jgi:hypothetical protein
LLPDRHPEAPARTRARLPHKAATKRTTPLPPTSWHGKRTARLVLLPLVPCLGSPPDDREHSPLPRELCAPRRLERAQIAGVASPSGRIRWPCRAVGRASSSASARTEGSASSGRSPLRPRPGRRRAGRWRHSRWRSGACGPARQPAEGRAPARQPEAAAAVARHPDRCPEALARTQSSLPQRAASAGRRQAHAPTYRHGEWTATAWTSSPGSLPGSPPRLIRIIPRGRGNYASEFETASLRRRGEPI